MTDDEGRRHHFLLGSYGFQSHINPGRVLAHRLARLGGADGSISATLSVPVATYRCMFPSPDAEAAAAKEEETTTDGVISYVPYSDGVDDGSMPRDAADRAVRRRATSASLSAVVARLAGRGQPVTCICKVDLLSTLGPTAQSDLVSRSDRERSAKPWLVGPCQTVPIKGGGEKGAGNMRFDVVHRKFHLLTLVRSRGGTGLMGSTTTPSS